MKQTNEDRPLSLAEVKEYAAKMKEQMLVAKMNNREHRIDSINKFQEQICNELGIDPLSQSDLNEVVGNLFELNEDEIEGLPMNAKSEYLANLIKRNKKHNVEAKSTAIDEFEKSVREELNRAPGAATFSLRGF